MNDSLGDRIKNDYENRTRYMLPRRTYTIARVDGKAFHTFTRGCVKPFDYPLMSAMDQAALRVCEQVQGCQLAYIQSDEVSFLLTDFASINTSAYFDGNLQKVTSVMASMFTAYFNKNYTGSEEPATFDCRVFTIPDPVEVENYFFWRWNDWRRNFVQTVARVYYSHSELDKLHRVEIQDKLFHEQGVDLAKYPEDQKHGRLCYKQNVCVGVDHTVVDSFWVVVPCKNLKENREFLKNLIPLAGY